MNQSSHEIWRERLFNSQIPTGTVIDVSVPLNLTQRRIYLYIYPWSTLPQNLDYALPAKLFTLKNEAIDSEFEASSMSLIGLGQGDGTGKVNPVTSIPNPFPVMQAPIAPVPVDAITLTLAKRIVYQASPPSAPATLLQTPEPQAVVLLPLKIRAEINRIRVDVSAGKGDVYGYRIILGCISCL